MPLTDTFFYYPNRTEYERPSDYGLKYEDVVDPDARRAEAARLVFPGQGTRLAAQSCTCTATRATSAGIFSTSRGCRRRGGTCCASIIAGTGGPRGESAAQGRSPMPTRPSTGCWHGRGSILPASSRSGSHSAGPSASCWPLSDRRSAGWPLTGPSTTTAGSPGGTSCATRCCWCWPGGCPS